MAASARIRGSEWGSRGLSGTINGAGRAPFNNGERYRNAICPFVLSPSKDERAGAEPNLLLFFLSFDGQTQRSAAANPSRTWCHFPALRQAQGERG